MGLVDAHGRETQPDATQQLIRIAGMHRQKLDALNMTIIQQGMLIEFLIGQLNDKLAVLETETKTENLQLSLEGFEQFAQARFKEMQAAAAAHIAEQEKQEQKPSVRIDD